MDRPLLLQFATLIVTLMGSGVLAVVDPSQRGAIAQSLPACQPPDMDEYLLMVIHDRADIQTQLEQTLPRGATLTTCDYLGKTVTRVGGFTSAETANSWAQYLGDMGGLQTFVTRPTVAETSASQLLGPAENSTPADAVIPPPSPLPAPSPLPDAPVTPAPSPTTPVSPPPSTGSTAAPPPATVAFNPQPLGPGYAVLVDYGNRPEVAGVVQQLLRNPVGLVSYGQRPYLLATHTPDLSAAIATLQQLGDRNLTAILVDSRRATLLTPAVSGIP